ncbi:DegT/DnrJ/EryC1/StrS family aminotransferase [bacterium]|nr:DegT/DnrJ/EryC1/StrS family aminotransferase [bacterium]
MKIITPSAGTPTRLKDIFAGFFGKDNFGDQLKNFTKNKHVLFTNSGTTAIYFALESLKKLSPTKNEVILQDYTAPSLILPIRKAGLKPILAETSLKTFNIDENSFEITENTLAILVIHMFGIPQNIENLRDKITKSDKKVFLLEDAASSMGSEIKNQQTGGLCEVGVISFNRGKNFSTLNGGAIFTNNEQIFQTCEEQVKKLRELSTKELTNQKLRTIALTLAVRPFFYTLLNILISKFKYKEVHLDFESFQFTNFQKKLGSSQFGIARKIFEKRNENGLFLYSQLKDFSKVTVPELPEKNCFVCFNQFPLLLKNPANRQEIVNKVLAQGLEITTLYDRPLHKVEEYEEFREMAKNTSLFQNSVLMSKQILLIPTHPLVSRKALETAIEIIKKNALAMP